MSARVDSLILLVPVKEAGCNDIGRVAAERGLFIFPFPREGVLMACWLLYVEGSPVI